MPVAGANAVVLLFDFDKTIIDQDSDNVVVDKLGATDVFEDNLRRLPWNTAMDETMRELNRRGVTAGDIAGVLQSAELDPSIVASIKKAHQRGCQLRVISDANRFFIETILRHHGILDCFAEVNTNPGFVDAGGRLRIRPFHDFHASPHGCPLCPPNMCKGKIVERIKSEPAADGKKRRFIYLGDGKGDYCPSLRLSADDYVMPRRDFPLWDLIAENPAAVKAEVHGWSTGAEQADTLHRLIDRALGAAAVEVEPPAVPPQFKNLDLGSRPLPLRVPS